jgi:hypothetical protein
MCSGVHHNARHAHPSARIPLLYVHLIYRIRHPRARVSLGSCSAAQNYFSHSLLPQLFPHDSNSARMPHPLYGLHVFSSRCLDARVFPDRFLFNAAQQPFVGVALLQPLLPSLYTRHTPSWERSASPSLPIVGPLRVIRMHRLQHLLAPLDDMAECAPL